MVSGRSGKREGWIIFFFFSLPIFAVNQKALLGESAAGEEAVAVAGVVGKEMREEEGEEYSWRAVPTSVMPR